MVAFVLEQLTFRIAYVHQLDFGGISGFVLDKEGTIAAAEYVTASLIAFIVFTFSSLLVAIQIASGQLSPRIIRTALLRDKVVRLLLAVGVLTRVDTSPRFLVSLMGILALVSVVVFMFLIDYAARLLRPIGIVRQLAQPGLQVIEDVYPRPIPSSSAPVHAPEKLGPPERRILHRGNSAIVIAVNLKALVAEARRTDVIIEFAPRVGTLSHGTIRCFYCTAPARPKSTIVCYAGKLRSGPSAPLSRTRHLRFASLSTSRSRRCRRQSTIRPLPCSLSMRFSGCYVR